MANGITSSSPGTLPPVTNPLPLISKGEDPPQRRSDSTGSSISLDAPSEDVKYVSLINISQGGNSNPMSHSRNSSTGSSISPDAPSKDVNQGTAHVRNTSSISLDAFQKDIKSTDENSTGTQSEEATQKKSLLKSICNFFKRLVYGKNELPDGGTNLTKEQGPGLGERLRNFLAAICDAINSFFDRIVGRVTSEDNANAQYAIRNLPPSSDSSSS